MKTVILTEDMSNKSIVRLMMEGTDYNQFQKIADGLGIPKSTLQSTLDRNTLKVKDLQKIAALLGYEIKIEQK